MSNTTPDAGTVLIVDDNPINLDLLFDYLDEAGFDVSVATDGETALNRAKYINPDIILLDVMMPGMNGFETCHLFKQLPETKEVPIIFMTALSETMDKVKGFGAGAVDYVTKPLHHEEVLARVKTHVTIRQLQQKLEAQNARLTQQARDLQTNNEELDAFAHTVAHELKTPLTALIGFAKLMQALGPSLSPEKFNEFLENIIQSGEHMGNITDELLLLARLRDETITPEPLDMSNIVNQSRTRLAYMLDEYNANLITPATWPIALGYGPWVEEVWVNYISNAIKYGGRPPHIELGATPQTDGTIQFWVKDNGKGLTPEEQAKLFTKFTQLKQIQSSGYGLGLSIVQRIVGKLGGQVGIESELGQGSCFYFRLQEAKA